MQVSVDMTNIQAALPTDHRLQPSPAESQAEYLRRALPLGVTRFTPHFNCVPEGLASEIKTVLRWSWFIGLPATLRLQMRDLLSATYDSDRAGRILLGSPESREDPGSPRISVPFSLFIETVAHWCNCEQSVESELLVFKKACGHPLDCDAIVSALTEAESAQPIEGAGHIS